VLVPGNQPSDHLKTNAGCIPVGGITMRFPFAAFAAASLCALASAPAAAQAYKMPPESERCPSKWGAGDQKGSANMMNAQSVLRAAKLIKTGETFDLGELLSPDPKEMFLVEGRQFTMYTKNWPVVPDARQINEELVITELGQVGTQIDAFAHQMWGDSFYNCFKYGDIATRGGFRKLGAEHIGGLMTRGVLIDVAGLKGVDMLPASYIITPEDLQQALAKAQMTIMPGDAVLVRTGWTKLIGKENERYGKANAGLGIAAGQWLIKQDPMMVAADNCCVEVRPSQPGNNLPLHAMFIIEHGVFLLENLNLEKLAAAGATEFAFVVQPLPIKGATGAPIAPMAIR
jgi:kynurenine formamidase